jgi:hypothetical protein
MTDLTDRLRAAADDTGQPLHTDVDELLGRAKAARTRQRVGRGAAAVAITTTLAVAVPFAWGSLSLDQGTDNRSVAPAASTPMASTAPSSATSSAPARTPLTEDEIVARCAPQLTKYNDLPRWRGGAANPVIPPVPADAWFVVNKARTTYRAGDVVALGETKYQTIQRLCLIPEEGREGDPVPFENLVPTAEDHELITQVCSEAEVVSSRGAPDVRDADVLVAQRTGDVLIAALSRGPDYFACTIPLPTLSDRVEFENRGPLRPLRELRVGLSSAVMGPKAGPVSSVYYWGNGFLPPQVATISLEVRGRAPVRFPVRDGAYAVALEVPITRIAPVRYTLLDAKGQVLHTSPWS